MSINRNALKSYAPKARREFIAATTARAAKLGITKSKTVPAQEQGDLVIIGADAYPKRIGRQRQKLLDRIALHGFDQTMEEIAYTWFNRLLAIRFMELHGYLDHGYRVLSHPSGEVLPEILEHAEQLEFPGLSKSKIVDLKLDGTKDAELYRLLLIAQCNALHRAMPFLFEKIDDETELLLPDNLLHTDSLIRKLVSAIDEADWQEIEIVGWLYQFYISEKKDQVIGKVVKSEDIPAATQLFTPNWIVQYMVQNSLGAQWMATYPDSALKAQMEYYIEPAEQTDEVQRQLAAITPKELNPEELTLIDPACGSGHILVEAYNLFKAIYLERGYPLRDVPRLILEKNLFGLDIDDRAAQMAGFALLMRARADDRRILSPDHPPLMKVMAIQDSKGIDADEIARALLPKGRFELVPSSDLLPDTLAQPTLAAETKSDVERGAIKGLIDLFAHGKTFGSLITLPDETAQALPALRALIVPGERDGLFQQNAKLALRPLVEQAEVLSRQYDFVVANPPYMSGMPEPLKSFVDTVYSDAKYNLYGPFVLRNATFCHSCGFIAMITLQGWMFSNRYENFRSAILSNLTIRSMAHMGPRAFDSIGGEVVSTTAFSFQKGPFPELSGAFIRLVEGEDEENKSILLKVACRDVDYKSRFHRSTSDFNNIPTDALAYWASARVRHTFAAVPKISAEITTREGMATGSNDRFLRFWHECNIQNIGFNLTSNDAAQASGLRWFPYVKGGGSRRWYGNFEYVVNWYDDGAELKNFTDPKTRRVRSHNYNGEFGFRSGISWSGISSAAFAVRYVPPGFMFDAKGPMGFLGSETSVSEIIGFLNSGVANHFIKMMAPDLDYKLGHVLNLPFSTSLFSEPAVPVMQAIKLSESDWDSYEESWKFDSNPLVLFKESSVENAYILRKKVSNEDTAKMQELEQKNNITCIQAYSLQEELSPDVSLSEVTLTCNPYYRYGGDLTDDEREERLSADTMRELISYAVGCMMGRYSLAEPGLIYAHAGNEGFNPARYGEFPSDDDGIVPITESEWFDDDAAVRFEAFLKVAWSPETLRGNLRFVAESLAANGGSDPQKTIRSYFAKSFFKDHLKTYKKRPIYWLFSSGKLRAFECLVYLHRYNESTLSRMRMEYVTPLQSRMSARIDQLTDDIASASSSAARTKAQKEKDLVARQLEELRAFDEELRHYADQRIVLHLDDGVKVNYGKLGNLLAEKNVIVGKKSGDDD